MVKPDARSLDRARQLANRRARAKLETSPDKQRRLICEQKPFSYYKIPLELQLVKKFLASGKFLKRGFRKKW